MKKIIYMFCFYVCFMSDCLAQRNCINCITFIDGKLPYYTFKGYLNYADSTGNNDTIVFFCSIGKLTFEQKDIDKLYSLQGNTPIIISLFYTEYLYGIPKKEFVYITDFFNIRLLICANYIIFNINNLNKKKNKYYFEVITSSAMTIPNRKEYKIMRKKEYQLPWWQRLDMIFHKKDYAW